MRREGNKEKQRRGGSRAGRERERRNKEKKLVK